MYKRTREHNVEKSVENVEKGDFTDIYFQPFLHVKGKVVQLCVE